jgi:GTP cyclohydrolase IA
MKTLAPDRPSVQVAPDAPHPRIDPAAGERAVAALLTALGEDATRDRLSGTPRRVVEMLVDAISREPVPVVSFVDGPAPRELVLVRDIPFQALCEHHLLPFRGVVHFGYLPGAHLVGVSLPVRVVDHFSRGLQLQERMTEEIADWLHAHLGARGVGIVVEAEHLCMSFRGVGDAATTLRTSAFRGQLAALPA